jgi:hypothetical protein
MWRIIWQTRTKSKKEVHRRVRTLREILRSHNRITPNLTIKPPVNDERVDRQRDKVLVGKEEED